MLKFKEVGIGVAISTESGLYTPTIKNIDKKSVSQISSEMKGLIEKAKNKQLRNSDFTDCAHAISNLGMFSVDNFDAIINPPNCLYWLLVQLKKKSSARMKYCPHAKKYP